MSFGCPLGVRGSSPPTRIPFWGGVEGIPCSEFQSEHTPVSIPEVGFIWVGVNITPPGIGPQSLVLPGILFGYLIVTHTHLEGYISIIKTPSKRRSCTLRLRGPTTKMGPVDRLSCSLLLGRETMSRDKNTFAPSSPYCLVVGCVVWGATGCLPLFELKWRG